MKEIENMSLEELKEYRDKVFEAYVIMRTKEQAEKLIDIGEILKKRLKGN